MTKVNGRDMSQAEDLLKRCENLEGDIESLKGKFMSDCKEIRDDIKSVIGEAADAGFDKKAFKAILKQRRLKREIDRLPDGFDIDSLNQYEEMSVSLGAFKDTELGRAALNATLDEARKSGAAAQTEKDLPKAGKQKKGKGGKKTGDAPNTATVN